MRRLEQKVVLVTGASRGLGRAVAEACAREGADLVICARRRPALEEAAAELRRHGGRVIAITADVSQPGDVDRLVSVALHEFGRIDVLINNAGVLGPSPMPYLVDYPLHAFAEVLRANVVGPFLITQLVLGAMLQQGHGSVINVTSAAGATGYAGWGAYGVSKFALEGLTETWAAETEETGIRVNMVDPGEMETEMHALAVPDCDYPLALPEDVTEAFVFLASDQSAGVTGKRVEAQEFTSPGGEAG